MKRGIPILFDPTVFENLKVAIENQLYDLDNLDGIIHITNRIDRLDMSVMSRKFALSFQRVGSEHVTAEFRLDASLQDLAAEILEYPGEDPACTLRLCFKMSIQDAGTACPQIDDILQRTWEPAVPPTQTVSFVYGQEPLQYLNTIELRFHRKINENQMEDIPNLIEHALYTLTELNRLHESFRD